MKKTINIIFSIILVVALSLTTVIVVLRPFGAPSLPEEGAAVTEAPTVADGFYNEGDEWFYYENGSKSQKTDAVYGTVNEQSGLWMTVDGKVDFSLVSIKKKENSWQYVKNGKVSEKTDIEASFIFGDVLNSFSAEKELSAFGSFEFTTAKQELLQSEIDKISAKGYNLGFVVMNMNSLSGFSYNADERIYSASTIKGPYVTSLVKSDNSLLDKEKARIDATLMRSSNYDYESLRDQYGDGCFTDFLSETGSDFVIDTTRNFQFMTPRALAEMWAESYVFFKSGETGERLGQIFEKPEVSPIRNVFSDSFTTRSKAGWVEKNNIRVTNDAGIVYTDNGDYVIVIMTTAPIDFTVVENMAEAIGKCL